MNNIITQTIILTQILLSTACSYNHGIERSIESKNSPRDGGSSNAPFVITNSYGNFYCEMLPPERLAVILKMPPFRTPGGSTKQFRTPNFTFFHIIVHNTGNLPVYFESPVLSCPDKSYIPLSEKEFRSRTQSPAYSVIDAGAVFARRRILSESRASAEIDYSNITVITKLDFIPVDDAVIIPLVFERIPVQCREYTLKFKIKSGQTLTPVEFSFVKTEFRTKGEHFKNPE